MGCLVFLEFEYILQLLKKGAVAAKASQFYGSMFFSTVFCVCIFRVLLIVNCFLIKNLFRALFFLSVCPLAILLLGREELS